MSARTSIQAAVPIIALALFTQACGDDTSTGGRGGGITTGGAPSNGGAGGEGAGAGGASAGGESANGGGGAGPCAAGRCVTELATVPGDAGAIAVGPDSVYWANPIDGSIYTVPKNGGEPSMFMDEPATALAADGASLFWIGSEELRKAPHGGGSPLTLALYLAGFQDLVLDGANVYFPLAKVPKNGGVTTPLSTTGALGNDVQGLASDGTSVLWANFTQVLRSPLDGGEAQEIAWDQCSINAVVVEGADVYWSILGNSTCPSSSSIMKAPIAGGEWSSVASGYFAKMVKDPYESAVYAVADQGLVRIPLPGGGPELVYAETGMIALAVDETSVYWTTAGNGVGKVFRLTPK